MKSNMLSGRATIGAIYSYPQAYETMDAYQEPLSTRLATPSCPPPTSLTKECNRQGRWPSLEEYEQNIQIPTSQSCSGAESSCSSCVSGACDELREGCMRYCNPDYTPGSYGPWLCQPVVTCGAYGCFKLASPMGSCKYVGGAIAGCFCQDVRAPREY